MAETTRAADVAGVVLEQAAGLVVLGLPGTDYRLHLGCDGAARLPAPGSGQRVQGRIFAKARRVDVVGTGGRYIEPVYGRPRRVQGAVAAVDAAANTITVACAPGCALTCQLTDPRQRAEQFAAGQLVSFDVERGARFEPM